MSESLGLSIGVANLVAARVGSAPVSRRSVLTLFEHRAAEVGVPEENPSLDEHGVVLSGFVEHVGQPAPLTAADGTQYRGETLTAEALEAMTRAVGSGTPDAIAVPAYWSDGQYAALRDALSTQPGLAPDGAPPAVISDATAALAALYAKPGFPKDGVVVLCDFGAGGTSVTLANAASNYQQIGPTVRDTEFSGDQLDQLILANLAAVTRGDNAERAGTAPLGSVSRRLAECRRAKEELSAATMTVVPAEFPGFGQDVRVSRSEFERLISGPLDRFVTAVAEVMERNGVPRGRLSGAAIVGGGACIPLLTNRLSDRLQVPIFTTPQPMYSAAIGAAVLGQQRASARPRPSTGPKAAAPTVMAGGQRTNVAPAGWAIQVANNAAGESVADNDPSATYRALAWSQDPSPDPDPIPLTDDDVVPFTGDAEPPGGEPPKPRWYTRPTLVTGAAGVAAVALVGVVVAVAFKLSATNSHRTNAPTNVTSRVESSAVQHGSGFPPSTAAPRPSTTREWTQKPAPPPVTVTTTLPTTTWVTTRPSTTLPTTTVPTVPTVAPTPGRYPPTTTWPQTATSQETTTVPPIAPTTVAPPWGY